MIETHRFVSLLRYGLVSILLLWVFYHHNIFCRDKMSSSSSAHFGLSRQCSAVLQLSSAPLCGFLRGATATICSLVQTAWPVIHSRTASGASHSVS